MKTNIGDEVLKKTIDLSKSVIKRIHTEYKGVKPFNKEVIEAKEKLFWYSQLQPMDMWTLRQKHGLDAVNKYIYEMTQLEKKTQAKGDNNG